MKIFNFTFSVFFFFFRPAEIPEEEEVTGWIPLAIKISKDSDGIRITKIDEVRLLPKISMNVFVSIHQCCIALLH